MSPDVADLFNEKWHLAPSGCLEWTASTAGKGYGQFRIPGTRKNIYAHRLSWELHNERPVPEGMMVLHDCDNPKCVNPDHLFLGTAGDNAQDMATKGRHLYGERNTKAKITEDDARTIISLKGVMTQRGIAKMFGISQAHAGRIQRGLKWAHLHRAEALN